MERNWFNQMSVLLDENKRELKNALYVVTFGGVFYALRSVRPFQKFRNARQIPETFINRRLKLQGTVLSVETDGVVLLRVDHKPIFGARYRRKSNPGLGVSINSINITGNGISWLQQILVAQNIKFTLLKRHPDYVSCLVYFNNQNVAEELLKIGFATVDVIDFDLEKDKRYRKYYKTLLQLENKAERKRLGIWSNTEYTILEKAKDKILNVLVDIFYKFRRKSP